MKYKIHNLQMTKIFNIYLFFLVFSIYACNKKPVAKFTYSPRPAKAATPVNFDGTMSHDPDGKIVKYTWKFDDGSTGNDSIVRHNFKNEGEFNVTLEVKDNKGKFAKITQKVYVEPAKFVAEVKDTSVLILQPDSLGYMVVSNENEDIFELILFPGCVSEPTEIKLIARHGSESEGMSRLVTKGIKILPDGLKLKLPASLIVTYNGKIEESEKIRIFNIKNPARYNMVSWQQITDSTIKGKLYHFSEYEIGIPNNSVKVGIDEGPLNGNFDVGISDFEEMVGGLEDIATWADALGKTDGNSYRENAKEIARKKAGQLLNEEVPSNPCKTYIKDFLRYGFIIGTTIPDEAITNQLRKKAKTIIDQCPLNAEIHYKFFTIPSGIAGGFSNPMVISKNSTAKILGSGTNWYWIGGPGINFEGGNMRMVASGNVNYTVNGSLEVIAPFRILLKLAQSTVSSGIHAALILNAGGQTFTINVDANTNGDQVSGTVSTPLFRLFISTSTDQPKKNLNFNYLSGDIISENTYGDELTFRQIWTLIIPDN